MHVVKKGLDLPVTGVPEQVIEAGSSPRRVAILADDFHGLKPSFRVQPGDVVRRGQALFEDKKTPGVLFTAPCAGTVTAIHRGERRSFQSLVIEATPGGGEQVSFQSYTGKSPVACDRAEVRELLVESGLWPAFRTRPFTRVPQLNSAPYAIFVTAMDTNPLAADVDLIAGERLPDMEAGLLVLGKLTDGKVHFCKKAGGALQPTSASGVTVQEFKGPHPAGTPGLHIHLIAPVGHHRTVWHIGIQDVLAIGRLFRTGELDTERVIALAGPVVKRPRLLKVRLGASLDDLTANELEDGENRVISGSILSGRKASGEIFGYLGRYHSQVSALKEDRERVFLGWLAPGAEKFSVVSAFVSSLIPDKKFDLTTTTNGGARAMVPIGTYERVMPFDILPTFLLRSLVVDDIEQAEELGCLELDEEDLALCTFVCPSKYDFGPILRRNLNTIEKEG
ncbi:MAG: Na(+)-translocating NADH-quinone reductase subunit A [Candidatus Hydrogenedentes bacterium]|nr:Na(+)-translocating NADH-quinone reductase subunit A [Candidatus Hydrogenedentota bacterium]